MLGSSRKSYETASTSLADRSGDLDALSEKLLAVSTIVGSSASLRGALSDSGSPEGARVALARSVFEGKTDGAALDVLGEVVGLRWRTPADLVDAIEGLGVEAALIAAERAGRLDAIEDELFRVDRIVAGNEPLRQTLADPLVDDDAKAALLRDVLGGRTDELTLRLVSHVVAHPRGRRLEAALADLVATSAKRRERLLAQVRVAAPLTDDQQTRLAAALGRIYRHPVDLQVDVDESTRGGVVVQVGDEVIDGSIGARIEQIRRRMDV